MSSSNVGQQPAPKGPITNLAARSAATNGLQQQAESGQANSALNSGQASSNGESAGVLYDLSSFDPLQAHAFQLTASAGFTNLLAHPPAVGVPRHVGETSASVAAQQGQQASHSMAALPGSLSQVPHAAPLNTVPHQQAAYYYIQPNATGSTLQPIAPAPHQAVTNALAPQPGPAASFLLPSAAPGTTLAGVPAAYQQQIFPNTIAATAGAPQAVIPSILMSQHLQNVVSSASHHPPPLAPAMALARKREGEDPVSTDVRGAKKQRGLAPSVISSSTQSTTKSQGGLHTGFTSSQDKPPQEASPSELARMTPADRRRYERNLREQQRSYKISQQIKELRDVLSDSNVPFKPNKYSILLSVVDYIKQLQARAIMLDSEHQKLITTIRQTNEMISSGSSPPSDDSTIPQASSSKDAEMFFVQGLDYRSVFDQCPAALGVAALDGRILECNPEFQLLLGFPKDEVLKQSLFNLVRNHQDIFRAMAEMLKVAEATRTSESASAAARNSFWSGAVISKQDSKLSINLTLTLGDDGAPKFFNCALTTSA